jgi:DNA-binding protein HU-beta
MPASGRIHGNDINIIGLMSFKIVEQAERKGRNPSTGKEITIPAGKSIKEAINA